MLFNRLKKFFTFMFRIAGYELLEFSNGVILLLGAYAVLRPDTDIYTNGTAYNVLETFLPEVVFGAIFLALGLFKLTALLDGSLKFRQAVAFCVTVFWAFLFAFLFVGNPAGMVYLWVGLFALVSVIIAARLRVDMLNRIPSWTQRL